MSALTEVTTRARAGRGGLALVEGVAGVGKSAVLTEAARDTDARVLTASGGEYEREFAFGAIRQLFEQVTRGSEGLFAGPATAARRLLGGTSEAVEAGPGILHAIFWLVANLAAVGPLVLVVDDLHWVDESSLLALAYLARRVPDLPVAVLGAMRPSEPDAPADLLDELRRHALVVRPTLLGAASVTELVRDRHPTASDPVCAAFHVASGGNPLYLRELLETTVALDPDRIARAAVPALGERVIRRIGRLAPEAPALAGAVAVLGDRQPLARAGALAELDPPRAELVAAALARAGVFASDDPVSFAHPVLRHSVHDALSDARRASMHASAAEMLEAAGAPVDDVARHLAALPPAGSPAVAARLLDAAEDALRRGDQVVALSRFDRALTEAAPTPSRAELLFGRGRALHAAGDPACLPTLQEAFALPGGPMRPQIGVTLAELLAQAGQWDACLAVYDQVTEIATTADLAMLAALRAAITANDAGRAAEFRARWDEYVDIASGPEWPARVLAGQLSAESLSRGDPASVGLGLARHAIADGVLLSQRAGAWAPAQLLLGLIGHEAHHEALAFSRAVLDAGLASASLTAVGAGTVGPMWVRVRRGELVRARDDLRTLTELIEGSGLLMVVATLAWTCADLLRERADARALIPDLLTIDIPPAFAGTFGGALLQEARGRVALGAGDYPVAVTALRAAAAVYRPLEIGPGRSSWRSLLAEAVAPTDREEADALVAEDIALARAHDRPRALGIALRTAGVLRGDLEALSESRAILDTIDAPLDQAYTELEIGALLRRRRQRNAAREPLAHVAELAQRFGAERLLARATDELLATGARPRRLARSGRGALTPSELRAAELAASGRSNADIARELYVSVKTVETHLSSAYNKLGIAGQGARQRLAAVLAAD